MKKLAGCFVSVLAVMVMALGFAACSGGGSADPDAYSFITIDINPSVELIALGNNVVEVKAANYDACVLLEGEDFSSVSVEDATAEIVALAEEMGYLTDSNNQVKISVISDDAPTVEVLKSAAKAGAQKGSKKAVAVTETRLQDELTVKKLKEAKPEQFADLTEEKVRLIESVMEHDTAMTYEAGAAMSIQELAAALKSAIDEDADIFTSELRSEYSARFTAAKQEIGREIAAIHGEEYLAAWEKYAALENVYHAIADRLDQSGLAENDIARVSELLGITDVSLIGKGGAVKPEYVLNYIDKHVNKKGSAVTQTAIETVLELLDDYDIAKHVLTEEEIAAVSEAIGENAEFSVISEVSDNIAARKADLSAMRKTIHLTSEQIAQIEVLKEGFSSIKESVLAEMRETIAAARAEIIAEKQERVSAD